MYSYIFVKSSLSELKIKATIPLVQFMRLKILFYILFFILFFIFFCCTNHAFWSNAIHALKEIAIEKQSHEISLFPLSVQLFPNI